MTKLTWSFTPKNVDDSLLPMLDITAPLHGVEISIKEDKTVIWVHVDGQTVLRICRIPNLY